MRSSREYILNAFRCIGQDAIGTVICDLAFSTTCTCKCFGVVAPLQFQPVHVLSCDFLLKCPIVLYHNYSGLFLLQKEIIYKVHI